MGLNKKTSTKVCIGFFFLLGGIEYAVILPTLWLYVNERFQAEEWFFGVIFASFSFSSLFASPLFGFWADFTHVTKTAILFANLFEIGGNVLYCVAWSKYWVLGARLLSGFGAGVGSAIFAQIARTTTQSERTGVFSVAMGLRQFGLLVVPDGPIMLRPGILSNLGPALNLFLREFNFFIGSYPIDKYTSPGLFMACLWMLLEILVLFLYYDLPWIKSSEKDVPNSNGIHSSGEKGSLIPKSTNSINSIIVSDEELSTDNEYREICNSENNTAQEKLRGVASSLDAGRPRKGSVMEKWNIAKDLIREEVIVILASQFMIFFNETAFETLVTPLSKHLLGWKELKNSFLYCLIALEAILTFVLVNKLSKRISDRWLLVIGITFEGMALLLYLILLANVKPYDSRILPTIVFGTLFIVFGLPFFSVANISLYSKITDERTQGIAQGVRRSVTGVAMILGPLWGGSLTNRLYIMMGVMMALETILAMLMFFSFNRLKEPTTTVPSSYEEISTAGEREPLLA